MAETRHVVMLEVGFARQWALEALTDAPVQVTLIDEEHVLDWSIWIYERIW